MTPLDVGPFFGWTRRSILILTKAIRTEVLELEGLAKIEDQMPVSDGFIASNRRMLQPTLDLVEDVELKMLARQLAWPHRRDLVKIYRNLYACRLLAEQVTLARRRGLREY